MSSRRGLGRGLSSLIPPTPPPAAEETTTGRQPLQATAILAIDDLGPNPRQPRQAIPPETLADLAASIKAHGLIQPLIVTAARATDPTPYIIIAGERRWRAARMAGLTEVPVVIKEASPQDLLEWALVENIQRADLNPLEEAAAYETLMTEFGLTQEQVAERVGKSRTAVANIVRLLKLPEAVKDLLSEGQIHEGHARALLGLHDEQSMVEVARLVVDRGLSVRQTEELVRRLNAPKPQTTPADEEPMTDPATQAIEARLRQRLGTRVNLFRTRKGGRIVIHFYSEEELAALYDRLVGEPL
jgi:ParB family chromosome partitioning protein